MGRSQSHSRVMDQLPRVPSSIGSLFACLVARWLWKQLLSQSKLALNPNLKAEYSSVWEIMKLAKECGIFPIAHQDTGDHHVSSACMVATWRVAIVPHQLGDYLTGNHHAPSAWWLPASVWTALSRCDLFPEMACVRVTSVPRHLMWSSCSRNEPGWMMMTWTLWMTSLHRRSVLSDGTCTVTLTKLHVDSLFVKLDGCQVTSHVSISMMLLAGCPCILCIKSVSMDLYGLHKLAVSECTSLLCAWVYSLTWPTHAVTSHLHVLPLLKVPDNALNKWGDICIDSWNSKEGVQHLAGFGWRDFWSFSWRHATQVCCRPTWGRV